MTLTQIQKAGLDEIALDHVYTVGASGTDHYTFQGEGLNGTVNDPTLYLTRGKTYRFEKGSAHPLRIQSTSGMSGTAYNTGVTNNGGTGTVIMEVQHDAPDVLYYQCTSHANMNGILYTVGALADSGVTTAKIADNNVTTAKIADSNVTTAKIADSAVTTGKIAADAINHTKIADDSIGAEHIIDNSVTSAKIPTNGVTEAKIATDAVTVNKIAANSVTTAKIADSNVTTAKIANNAVTADKLPNAGVTLAKLQNIAQDRIIGRISSGSGAMQELTAANIRTMINVADGATAGGGGKVTRVFQTTAGTSRVNYTAGGYQYMGITVSSVPSTARYLIFCNFSHRIYDESQGTAYAYFQSQGGSTSGASLSSTTNSTSYQNYSGMLFDSASNTTDRTFEVRHYSNSYASYRKSDLTGGVLVVLELDFS